MIVFACFLIRRSNCVLSLFEVIIATLKATIFESQLPRIKVRIPVNVGHVMEESS